MGIGWAYVDCATGTGGSGSAGPSMSLQFVSHSGPGHTTGSVNLRYFTASYGGKPASTLHLTGTLYVEGTISASHFHTENVTRIDATGSTFFGNTNDDRHIRTGSMAVGPTTGYAFQVDAITKQTMVTGFRGGFTHLDAGTYTTTAANYLIGVRQSGDVTITLHSAATSGTGSLMIIKDQLPARGGSSIYISSSAGEKIDDGPWYELTGTMPAISLYSNGADWFVF